MRLTPLVSLSFLAILLGGCQSVFHRADTDATIATQVGSGQTLSAADNGTTVSLSVGETLSVSLEGNASTGYSWTLSEDGSPVLAQPSIPVSTREASATAMVGAPETTVWTFAARRKGQTTLKLEYRRAWEKDAAPAQTFELKVRVTQ